MGALHNHVPTLPPENSHRVVEGANAPTWQKRVLEVAVELAGIPALITVIADCFTESQRILAIWAGVGLIVAIALRFLPRLERRPNLMTLVPWLLASVSTLMLLLVISPNRLTEQNKLLADSWLGWQKNLEQKAAVCAKDAKIEPCLVHSLTGVLSNRPRPIKSSAITELASDVVAGQLLLANETTRGVLKDRLSVDDRFIGTGYSVPVGSISAEEATVSDYTVPNLTESAEFLWVWKVKFGDKMDGTPLSEHTLRDVLHKVPPMERADHVKFNDNWRWINDHLRQDDPHPALVRFAQLDLSHQKPSGCLGRSEATRVFMNGLGDVVNKKLYQAFHDSGHTLVSSSDESNVWLFIWVYIPTQQGIAIRATWSNVLNNFSDWVVADQCLAKK